MKVLIIDRDSSDSLAQLPGLFHDAGYCADVLCLRKSWLRRNRFHGTWIPAESDDAKFIEQIITIARSGHYAWIIPGDDKLLSLLAKHIHDPDVASKVFPVKNLANRELLGSKKGFIELAQRYNLPIPSSEIATTADISVAAERIGYPVIIKNDQGSGGMGIHVCRNADEVTENTSNMQGYIIAQHYIPGDTINVEAIYRSGRLLAYAYSVVIETVGNEFSVSSKRRYEPNPSIELILYKIGESFTINGFANLSLIRAGDGQHFLIESDLRAQAWFAFGKFAGVDFAHGIKNFISNDKSAPVIRQTKNEPIIIIHPMRDIIRGIKRGGWRVVWGWARNEDERSRFVEWRDLFLMCWIIVRIINIYFKK